MKPIKGKVIEIQNLKGFDIFSIEEWRENKSGELIKHLFSVNLSHSKSEDIAEGDEILVYDYVLTAKETSSKRGGVFYPLNIWAQEIHILSNHNKVGTNHKETDDDSDVNSINYPGGGELGEWWK